MRGERIAILLETPVALLPGNRDLLLSGKQIVAELVGCGEPLGQWAVVSKEYGYSAVDGVEGTRLSEVLSYRYVEVVVLQQRAECERGIADATALSYALREVLSGPHVASSLP
jgi:hypothetical protein